MKRTLILASAFLLLLSGALLAQEARFYAPPIQPVPGYIPAKPELRVYDAGVHQTQAGTVIQATVQAIFWEGVNNSNEAIVYNYTPGSETQERINSYRIIEKDFRVRAYLYVYGDRTLVDRIVFDVKGGLRNATTMEFNPIPLDKKLLTARYIITVEIYPAQQGAVKDYIWVDDEVQDSGDHRLFVRQDPRRILPVKIDSFLLVTQNEDGSYQYVKEGDSAYYEKILEDIKGIRNVERYIENMQKELQKPDITAGHRGYVQSTIMTKRQELEILKTWQNMKTEIERAFERAEKREAEFSQKIRQYYDYIKGVYRDYLNSLREFYSEVAWTGNLCLPNWKPSDAAVAESGKTLSEIVRDYKISQLVSGRPGEDVRQGAWRRDRWMERVNNVWFPRIEELKKDFRKIFGKAMDEKSTAKETDRDYYGVIEKEGKDKLEYEWTFWQPLYRTQYENLFKTLFEDKLLEVLVKAYSNLMAYQHTLPGKAVEFPFTRPNSDRAEPNWGATHSTFNRLSAMRRDFGRVIGGFKPPKQPPAIDWKPPRTKWVCPNCKAESQFQPPNRRCPVCKTTMEEKPNVETEDDGPQD